MSMRMASFGRVIVGEPRKVNLVVPPPPKSREWLLILDCGHPQSTRSSNVQMGSHRLCQKCR